RRWPCHPPHTPGRLPAKGARTHNFGIVPCLGVSFASYRLLSKHAPVKTGRLLFGKRARLGNRFAFWIVAAPLSCQRQEVAHDPAGIFRRPFHLDVELRSIDITILDAKTLVLRQAASPLGGDQDPLLGQVGDLAAMTLHGLEFARQTLEDRISSRRTDAVL